MEIKQEAPYPPPDLSDLVKNEELLGQLKKKYKADKEIQELISTSVSLNAECRRLRNKMWSETIHNVSYNDLMRQGRLIILAPKKVEKSEDEESTTVKAKKEKKKKTTK